MPAITATDTATVITAYFKTLLAALFATFISAHFRTYEATVF